MQFILLNTIKYGDKAFVLQVYSREEGRISLFLRGVGRNSNYRAWMHKLSIMEAEMVERSNGMPVIKEMRPVRELLSIRSSVIKGGIALFMSELVLKGIREVEASREMFDFLVRGINLLEECREGVANFPIYFLTHFCRVAGFAPTDNYSPGTVGSLRFWGVLWRRTPDLWRETVWAPLSLSTRPPCCCTCCCNSRRRSCILSHLTGRCATGWLADCWSISPCILAHLLN